jgi:hypothetical protein
VRVRAPDRRRAHTECRPEGQRQPCRGDHTPVRRPAVKEFNGSRASAVRLCRSWSLRSAWSAADGQHGLTADRYRDLTGLLRSQPLVAPGLSRKHAADLRRRQKTDKRIQAGCAADTSLPRTGELSDRASVALDTLGRPRARKDQLRRRGSQLGTAGRRTSSRPVRPVPGRWATPAWRTTSGGAITARMAASRT